MLQLHKRAVTLELAIRGSATLCEEAARSAVPKAGFSIEHVDSILPIAQTDASSVYSSKLLLQLHDRHITAPAAPGEGQVALDRLVVRDAHMQGQMPGATSCVLKGSGNRGCEFGALRPLPAAFSAASVLLRTSTVRHTRAHVPGNFGLVHVTHVSMN